MSAPHFIRRVLTLAPIAALAACAGFQPASPAGSNSEIRAVGTTAAVRHQDLVYLTSPPDIYVFSFPAGKLISQIKGDYPYGLCVNSSGDIFVVDPVADDVTEYSHGATKPKATLRYPGYEPTQCAANPATGDVAVISGSGALIRHRTEGYYIWVYPAGTGAPVKYDVTSLDYLYYASYDEDGDLFIDGRAPSGKWGLVKLPNGKKKFETIELDQEILNRARGVSAIQWNGNDLAIGATFRYPTADIDRISIKGKKANFVRETHLLHSAGIGGFWIDGTSVVVPQGSEAYLWRYPKNSKPYASFGVADAVSAIVSLAIK